MSSGTGPNGKSTGLRRWINRSNTTQMSVPLVDRTNTQRSNTTAATATSSFLPELNSTPPMPTFQKKAMTTPTPVRSMTQSDLDDENATPTRGRFGLRKPGQNAIPQLPEPADPHRGQTANAYSPRDKAWLPFPERYNQPATASASASHPPALAARAKPKPVATTTLRDRIGDTPPLPETWGRMHDRAICVLEIRNYSLEAMVSKLRRTFPELEGILTPDMLDKRLRQLDQNVEIGYWREAIEAMDREEARRNVISPPAPSQGLPAAMSTMTLAGIENAQERGASPASLRVRRNSPCQLHPADNH